MRKTKLDKLLKAWLEFKPVVPFSYLIAAKKAQREKWGQE